MLTLMFQQLDEHLFLIRELVFEWKSPIHVIFRSLLILYYYKLILCLILLN